MGVLVVSLVAILSCGAIHCQQAPAPDCSRDPDAQVLILGAGLAGLSAAGTLSENGIDDFLIIDQLDRIGGRVRSEQFAGSTVELGPQWVLLADRTVPEELQHPLLPLVARCNVSLRDPPLGGLPSVRYNDKGEDITEEVNSLLGRYQEAFSDPETNRMILEQLPRDQDIPVSVGLRTAGWFPRTPIEEHAEFISFDFLFSRPTDTASFKSSADPSLILPRALAFGFSPVNYIVTDPVGYRKIPQCIADEFLSEDDPRVILRTTVTTVEWSDECVCVLTESSGNEQRYCAPYAIITFSIGELQNRVIKFVPELPFIKHFSLNKFEMANFLKVYVAFNDTFWDTDVDFITYFDEINGREYYPIFTPWGDFFPGKPPILEAYLTGDTALQVAHQDEEITKRQIGQVLRNIYGERASDPVDLIMHDFIISPYFLGDFSSNLPTANERIFEELNIPLGRLYFGGEAYERLHQGSAHGAVIHGESVARRVLEEMQAPAEVVFINDSPRTQGNVITAEFRISNTVTSVQCRLLPSKSVQNCTLGQVTFSDLVDGTYQLRVIARNEDTDQRASANRRLVINSESQCAVHLINSGVSVIGTRATIEFSSSGLPVTEFSCGMDSQSETTCSSPLVLRNLNTGDHRVKIRPQCGGSTQLRRTVRFNV